MIVKFFSRGKGGGSGPVDYLLGKDRERDLADLLRGDPDEIIELIDTSPYAKKYTAGVLSFHESDLPANKKEQIMNSFERALLPGLDKDQYSIAWIEHRDKDRLELNFVVPNIELTTGKRLQPYYDRADRPRIDAWKSWVNAALDLHDPDDPGNAKTCTFPADLPRNKQQTAEKITDVLTGMIGQGLIDNRDDIVSALENNGFTVARRTRSSISIEDPAGGRNIRLKGAIYEEHFRSGQLLAGEHATRSREFKADRQKRARRSRERYQELHQRKYAANQKRYRRAEPPEPQLAVEQLPDVRASQPGRSGADSVSGRDDRRPMGHHQDPKQDYPEPERSDFRDRSARVEGRPVHHPAQESEDRDWLVGRRAPSHQTVRPGGITHDSPGKSLIERLGEITRRIAETTQFVFAVGRRIARDVQRDKKRIQRLFDKRQRFNNAARDFEQFIEMIKQIIPGRNQSDYGRGS